MAETEGRHARKVSMKGSNEVGKEKWAKHYSSNHQILLVGEGDFSFALSLATSFGSASNIVATSLDSYDILIKKYKRAKTNLKILDNFGAQLLHGVDSTRMKLHPDLRMRKFDRIVYNFPHAGFVGQESDRLVIMMHRSLVRGFLRNASAMLRVNGEVHVSHKTKCPFYCWNIEELATQSCLKSLECVNFKIKDYPGYNNKRGDGKKPDQPFPLGKCKTFKFILSSKAMKSARSSYKNPIPLQRENATIVVDRFPIMMKSTECFRIFREYFNHECLACGQGDNYLPYSFRDMLKIGFDRYNVENHGKALKGYVNLVEELRMLSKQRVAFLRKCLSGIDQQYPLMAEIAGIHSQQTPMNGSNEVVDEKWANHYSSNHQILLIGEGDFSFALSLAMSFDSASNIVASSLDTYGTYFLLLSSSITIYKNAKENLDMLAKFGGKLLHGVNSVTMKSHTDLQKQKFDRIVFNFPHSGFPDKESDHYTIVRNKNLVQSFLWNARSMLRPKCKIHVTHKTTYPYNCWKIEELATQCGLTFVECVDFKIEDYPGYNNKRGDQNNPDLSFSPVKCSTFKFMVSSNAKKSPPEFPFQTEMKKLLALMHPLAVAHLAPGMICVTECLIPDLSPLQEDSKPSSSGVGSSQPPHK
ncbi:hypothetical protein LXL04_037258 [Taraxacum kok-saghyz]